MIGELGEFDLIERLTRGVGGAADVVKGVGDDTAILATTAGTELLVTCDAQIEGVHFLPAKIAPRQLGRRIAAVNLSDVAAMGGRPKFALLSMALPDGMSLEYLEAVYEGLVGALSTEGAVLVGGNTAKSPTGMVFDMTLLGEVARGAALRRDAAVVGDGVWVSGGLGASAAGLRLLLEEAVPVTDSVSSLLVSRHQGPTARCEVGRHLGGDPLIGACIDISDGLVADARHVAEQSRCDLVLELDRVPLADGVEPFCQAIAVDPRRWAASSGEEYELLFTARSDWTGAKQLATRCGVPVTRVGRIEAGEGRVWEERDGIRIEAAVGGFDHFKTGMGSGGRGGRTC